MRHIRPSALPHSCAGYKQRCVTDITGLVLLILCMEGARWHGREYWWRTCLWCVFPGYWKMLWYYRSWHPIAEIKMVWYRWSGIRLVQKLLIWSQTMCSRWQHHIRCYVMTYWGTTGLYPGPYSFPIICKWLCPIYWQPKLQHFCRRCYDLLFWHRYSRNRVKVAMCVKHTYAMVLRK